jgi:hypothetical protein
MIDILTTPTGTQIKDYLSSLAYPLQQKADEQETYYNTLLSFSKRNGQKMIMQRALNEIFGQAANYIYIIWGDRVDTSAYTFNNAEADSMWVSNSAENAPRYVIGINEPDASPIDFSVCVPNAIYTAELVRRIKYEVNRIKLAGMRFEVINANVNASRAVVEAISATHTQTGLAEFNNNLQWDGIYAGHSQSALASLGADSQNYAPILAQQAAFSTLSVTLDTYAVEREVNNPNHINATSPSVTAIPSGGNGVYTYYWEYVSGEWSWVADLGDEATTTFTGLVYCGNVPNSADWRCRVTDGLGQVAYSPPITITMTNTNTNCN